MDKATVETIVIDDDDDNGITVPKRERKPSAKPGQVIFPADLPKNVVQLIRLWQHVNKRAALPSEESLSIYRRGSKANTG